MQRNLMEFYRKYQTSEKRREVLKKMNDEEIDILIKESTNLYGKIYFSSFKKTKNNNK